MNLSKSLLAYLMVKQANLMGSVAKGVSQEGAGSNLGQAAGNMMRSWVLSDSSPVFSSQKGQTPTPAATPSAKGQPTAATKPGTGVNAPIIPGTASQGNRTSSQVFSNDGSGSATYGPNNPSGIRKSTQGQAASTTTAPKPTAAPTPAAAGAPAPTAAPKPTAAPTPAAAGAPAPTAEQSLAAAREKYLRTNDDSSLKAHFKQFPSEAQQLIRGAGDEYKEIGKQVDAFGKGHDARAQAYDHRNEWINRDSGGSSFLQGDSSQRYSRTHPESMSVIDGGKGRHIQPLDSSLFGKADKMMAKADQIRRMQMQELGLPGTPAVASAPPTAKPTAAPA